MIEWEIEELACLACGKTEEETDKIIDDGDVDNLLNDKYEISFEQYCQIVKDLLLFTMIVKTELTNNLCRGFIKDNCFIVKEELCDKER